jgi:hypothetical protein
VPKELVSVDFALSSSMDLLYNEDGEWVFVRGIMIAEFA